MSIYQHNWPEFEFGWRIVLGSTIGFLGAAMGSVGGIGGGAIFVPMLFLIIGFDPKSSAAVSKCMIMGTAAATVYYNSRLSHPTFSNMPLIDYDLALLFQPLLMVGISVGVALNIIFAEWMITILLIFLFLVNASRCFMKGVEIWEKETAGKQETTKQQESDGMYVGYWSGDYPMFCHFLLDASLTVDRFHTAAATFVGQVSVELPLTKIMEEETKERKVEDFAETEKETAHLLKNAAADIIGYRSVHRVAKNSMEMKQLVLLVFVWVTFFAVQIMKTRVVACSTDYWILDSFQVITGFTVSVYQAVCLYRGTRVISSSSKETTNWNLSKLLLYFFTGVVAGTVGGMLGIGGGICLGGSGIIHMIHKVQNHEYMGFQSLCNA